ncbi:MAG TPA: DNA replication/repair protein RecF [Halanaerobiales bacterium]|nr:DNA replication/repair protein RecF [Halanaerobiales bacterium]
MYIEKILLKNYRNIDNSYLNLDPNLNIFIGNNGQGKTNLLEAVYLMATTESHRTNRDSELIQWDKESALVQLKLIKDDYDLTISYKIEGRNKQIKINKNPLEKISDLVGNLNVILFSPEDLKIVKGGPNNRRKFLDLEISQVNPYYYHLLKEYDHILRQRNKLLKKMYNKSNRNIDLLEVWDDKLAEKGAKILYKRLQVLNKLKILARLAQRKLTAGQENLNIKYDCTLNINKNNDKDEINKIFLNKLKRDRKDEFERGYTLSGPHRDDLILTINEMNVRKYGSQGQQRTVALGLKLAELEFMKSESGEYPVLLLDDVFSELDKNRRNTLLSIINDKIQTLITTTDSEDIETLIKDKGSNIYNVKDGVIQKR